MMLIRWNVVVCAAVLAASVLSTACRRTYVVVPRPDGGYSATDTLRGRLNGTDVRVTFRFDTIAHVRTIIRVDTIRLQGEPTGGRSDTVRVVVTDTVQRTAPVGRVPPEPPARMRVDTVVRIDTVRVPVTTTVQRVDTVRVPVTARVERVDTVQVQVVRVDTLVRVDSVRVPVTATTLRVDTVRVVLRDTVIRRDTVVRADTVTMVRADTVTVVRADTITMVRADTVTLMRTDTVTLVRTDTVRVAGRRVLFVPPGQYPPDGQCRVWIHDVPPGQQASAAPCDQLGGIPSGAFILFRGEAWDFDYDWLRESGSGAAPPEIVALKRRGG